MHCTYHQRTTTWFRRSFRMKQGWKLIPIPKSTARVYLWIAIQFLKLQQNYEYLSNLGEYFLTLIQGLLIHKNSMTLSHMIQSTWLLIDPVGILPILHGLSKRIHYLILMEIFHFHWSENPKTLFLKIRLKYVHVKLRNKKLMIFCFPPVVGILREAMVMDKNNGSLLNMQ